MRALWPPFVELLHRRATAWRIRRPHIGDMVAMQHFVDSLGASNRRWRFHGAVRACSARLAATLIQGEAVWAAFHGGALIGEARFVCDRVTPECAELAMAVADAWQGRGVATALLATLLAQARSAGVRVLRADVMCSNARMQRFLQRHGFAPLLQWDAAGETDVYEHRLVDRAFARPAACAKTR
jgi:GNAT superfamily N-acetyltransferase